MKTLNLKKIASITSIYMLAMGIIMHVYGGENEPKVEVEKVMTDQWVNVAPHPSSPGDFIITNKSNTDTNCNQPSGQLCAVELSLPNSPEIADLLDRIDQGTNLPSLSEFIAEAATVTDEVYKTTP